MGFATMGKMQRGDAHMTIEGAVIIEKGVTFAIIHVAPEVTRYTIKSTQTARF